MGAKQLAEAKAVVKNLTDVETLGATSAINTDKTGTLTLNQMMVSTMYYAAARWFTVEGEGYREDRADPVGRRRAGARLHPAGARPRASTATRPSATTGAVVGDPTEAALVVLAAKLGVDAEETRRAYPRLAEVPFDSEYKFMATFHRVLGRRGRPASSSSSRAAPTSCSPGARRPAGPTSGVQVPIEQARAGIEAANERMGEKGLRVLAFAARLVDDDELAAMAADPMSLVHDLVVRRHGRDHRPAARRGRRPPSRSRSRAGHRRADDHRRPRRHRRAIGESSGSARARSAAPSCRR